MVEPNPLFLTPLKYSLCIGVVHTFLGGGKVVIRTESKYFILCECGGCIKPLSSEYITIMAWPILFKKQFFYNAIP